MERKKYRKQESEMPSQTSQPTNRYRDFNSTLRQRFGSRVQKISIDAGLTCPNRDGTLGDQGCIYCNARGSGTGASLRGISITEQLEAGKAAMGRRYKAKRFLAYFQSFSNTYAPVAVLNRLWTEALAVPGVVGLCIGTRPDCVAQPVLDLLEAFARNHLVWIEYGLQSSNDATLARIGRGHDFAAFQQAVAMTRNRGIQICAHMICGLPGETRETMLATAKSVADAGIDGIKIHLLYVVRGTAMEALYASGAYRCLAQPDYVQIVCDIIERLPGSMVIQRLTGDPHPEELVAPKWSLQKRETLAMIHAELARRDTWQGKEAGRL
jgi:radical SAM protein (TIGR01212 family)